MESINRQKKMHQFFSMNRYLIFFMGPDYRISDITENLYLANNIIKKIMRRQSIK